MCTFTVKTSCENQSHTRIPDYIVDSGRRNESTKYPAEVNDGKREEPTKHKLQEERMHSCLQKLQSNI